MKAKLLFFLLLVLSLQVNNSINAMVMKTRTQITLKTKSIPSPRSIQVFPNAFIDGRLLSIELPSVVTSVTATVKDAGTGEIIYSSVYSDVKEIMINLNGENTGKYTLELCFDETIVLGEFVF